MTDDGLLPPDEAFDAAVAQLQEWLGQAEQAAGDARGVQYPDTVLANAAIRMATLEIRKVVSHRPVYIQSAWVCPLCVELQQVGFTRAAAPCAEARAIFEMLGIQLQEAAPGGLQMIVQDGAEPYVSLGAAELERMHGLEPVHARTLASSVVRVIAGIRARAMHL
jgi:hypothetical protein